MPGGNEEICSGCGNVVSIYDTRHHDKCIRNLKKIKTTTKSIVMNGRLVQFLVVQEPQADLYQVQISSLGMGLFTKTEIDVALTRALKIRRKYRLSE